MSREYGAVKIVPLFCACDFHCSHIMCSHVCCVLIVTYEFNFFLVKHDTFTCHADAERDRFGFVFLGENLLVFTQFLQNTLKYFQE